MLTLTTFPVFRKSPSKETPTKKTPFQSYWLSSARGCCKRCHHCHRHPFGAAECTSLWFPRGLSDLQRAWMKWSPDGMGRWFHKIGFRGIKRTEWISIDIFFWGGASNIKDARCNTHVLTLEDGLSLPCVLNFVFFGKVLARRVSKVDAFHSLLASLTGFWVGHVLHLRATFETVAIHLLLSRWRRVSW